MFLYQRLEMSLNFRKFISEVFMNDKFPKILPSENFPPYGISLLWSQRMLLSTHGIQCRIRVRLRYFINWVRLAWPGQNATQMTWPSFNLNVHVYVHVHIAKCTHTQLHAHIGLHANACTHMYIRWCLINTMLK